MTKAKRGRPFKEDKPLSEMVLVRLNEDEKENLEQLAEKLDKTLAGVIRDRFRGYEELQDVSDSTEEMLQYFCNLISRYIETGEETVPMREVLKGLHIIDTKVNEMLELADKNEMLEEILNNEK